MILEGGKGDCFFPSGEVGRGKYIANKNVTQWIKQGPCQLGPRRITNQRFLAVSTVLLGTPEVLVRCTLVPVPLMSVCRECVQT